MENAIRFLASNYTLTFLVLGFVAAAVSLARAPQPPGGAGIVEAFFSYFLLFSIGIGFFYNFVVHTFFGEISARFIGWQPSPFQAEVGFASLGFAAVGFLAFRGSFELRLAAILAPALFLLGAAAGHVYDMVHAGNFAPGNAGIIFYTDIIIPIMGFAFLWLQRRSERKARQEHSRRQG